ncbi:MAG: CBS domain-containing protein [Bdellovibrio sp. CG10_big_fil_rev_8_21_14_0_10_47_8]|nr:MAG: CBS domain-containing protein [Bdellovibrio sp. CG10_big_fil_rev_8_21_14_0_10_47_8]
MLTQIGTHIHDRLTGTKTTKNVFGTALDQMYETKVVSLTADASVFDAAQLMLSKHVGDIVVVEEKNGQTIPKGIVTDRDIVINTIAQKKDPATMKLSELMLGQVVTATDQHSLSDLVRLMTEQGVSRMPIVDDKGALKGILSSKRLYQFFAQGLCELSSLSKQQQEREGKRH